jgi:hypothetical protein
VVGGRLPRSRCDGLGPGGARPIRLSRELQTRCDEEFDWFIDTRLQLICELVGDCGFRKPVGNFLALAPLAETVSRESPAKGRLEMKGACDGVTDTARPSRVVAEPIATRQRVQLSQRSLSQRSGRPCARCGVVFQRTPVRWMTCLNCYLVNSKDDPLEFRAGLSSSLRRPRHLEPTG